MVVLGQHPFRTMGGGGGERLQSSADQQGEYRARKPGRGGRWKAYAGYVARYWSEWLAAAGRLMV